MKQKYYNSKGEEVSYYWWKILEAGRAVGRFGRTVGRRFGPFLKSTIAQFAALLFTTGRKLGPVGVQLIFGLVKEASEKNLSGGRKLRWVMDRTWAWLGDRADEFRTAELSDFINSTVWKLKKKGNIQ